MSTIKEIKGEEFRRLQLTQLDMILELDRVCRENNINYVIFGGTLLGAVRHKGYIPWDDDADIAMLREDYERFKSLASQLDPSICFFQDHSTDPLYRWGYGKLRRTGTVFIRAGQEHIKCKTGVFIDVFPLDDIPKSVAGQMLQDFCCFCLRKITWSEVGRLSEKGVAKVFWTLVSQIPVDWVFRRLAYYTRKSRNDSPNYVRILMFQSLGKHYRRESLKYRYGFPKEWIKERAEYEFEGHTLYGTKDYDKILSSIYGDYMKMPPENQRDPHAPVSEYQF